MKIEYRVIHLGEVIHEEVKEYDGGMEANLKEIENEVYTGMDPLQLASQGRKAAWITYREIKTDD